MILFTKHLLKIENQARNFFENFPFAHAFLAGVGVVLFWRGVWETADRWGLNSEWSVIIGILILGGIGLFLQTFVGNTIIIKNVEKEQKIEKEIKSEMMKTYKETANEEVTLAQLAENLKMISAKVDKLLEDKER